MPKEQSLDVYDALRAAGIRPDNVESLMEWSSPKLYALAERCESAIPHAPSRAPSALFSFIANDNLSGLPSPCGGAGCRLGSAEKLAQFAALYANRVYVRSPFELHLPHFRGLGSLRTRASKNPTQRPRPEWPTWRRKHLVIDIRILWLFQPLVEAGLLLFAKSQQHFCPQCVREADDKGELEAFVGPTERTRQQTVSAMVRWLDQEYRRDTTATLDIDEGEPRIIVRGPERLVSHGETSHRPPLTISKATLERAAAGPVLLSAREAKISGVYNHAIRSAIDDLTTQSFYSQQLGCDYLTTRELDLDLVQAVSTPSLRSLNRGLVDSFTHALPFVTSVPIKNLLNLRRRESEAFEVYRDAVHGLLSDMKPNDAEHMRQALADVVRPEVNRLNLTIKNARKALAIPATTSVAVALGAMSVAFFSGILPGGAGVASAALAAGTTLGGFAGAGAIVNKVHQAAAPTAEARNSRFFFLWKVLKASSDNGPPRAP